MTNFSVTLNRVSSNSPKDPACMIEKCRISTNFLKIKIDKYRPQTFPESDENIEANLTQFIRKQNKTLRNIFPL